MRYISIDIETTGLNPENCQILELAAVVEDTNSNTAVNKLPCFQTLFSYNHIKGEPAALRMNADIINRISKGEGLVWRDAMLQFERFLKENGFKSDKHGIYKFTVAGKNYNGFDARHLETTPFHMLFKPHRRVLDPAILYARNADEVLPDLAECKLRAGLDPIVKHRALDDACDVIELIRKSGLFNKQKIQ